MRRRLCTWQRAHPLIALIVSGVMAGVLFFLQRLVWDPPGKAAILAVVFAVLMTAFSFPFSLHRRERQDEVTTKSPHRAKTRSRGRPAS